MCSVSAQQDCGSFIIMSVHQQSEIDMSQPIAVNVKSLFFLIIIIIILIIGMTMFMVLSS